MEPLGLGKRKSDTEIFLALPSSPGSGAAFPKLSGYCGKNPVNQRKAMNFLAVFC